jgi:hypothetical protein
MELAIDGAIGLLEVSDPLKTLNYGFIEFFVD